jgi:hypothetical protein
LVTHPAIPDAGIRQSLPGHGFACQARRRLPN